MPVVAGMFMHSCHALLFGLYDPREENKDLGQEQDDLNSDL